MNKNNNIKSLPVKICFLKDDRQKAPLPQPQQKLSLTFLSSYIQQDRAEQKSLQKTNAYLPYHSLKSTKNYKNENSFHPYQLNLTQPQFKTPKISSTHNQPLQIATATQNQNPKNTNTYKKWLEVKSNKKSMTDEKRFLNNLVGENWEQSGKKLMPKWMQEQRNIQKKTIKKRMDTFEEQQRKEGNDQMLKTHFQCFIESLKRKPVNQQKVQDPKVVMTKIDERLQEKRIPFRDQIQLFQKSNRSRSKNNSLMYAQKPKTTSTNTRKKSHNQFDSIAARVGFKEIPNFEWHRVNKNAKFKLRKV